MIEQTSLKVSPRVAADNDILRNLCAKAIGVPPSQINDFVVVKRSIDARRSLVSVCLTIRVATGDDSMVLTPFEPILFSPLPADAPTLVIVGAGPAGLFAALQAIRGGIRPIVLERGKDVDSRRLDLAALNRSGEVDADSNYCFGEGGAGTFSDGKLFTRSKKRGDNEEVLRLLVQHGASDSILVDAHPHIGSDRLPHIIKNIRQTIIDCGGEVRFSTKADSLIIEEDDKGMRHAKGVLLSNGDKVFGPVILATGHSSRDFLRSLHAQGVEMETKGFAMGVRLEHPSNLIDRLQYHTQEGRGKYLPAAEYNFVTQADGRGVYSFCMCPGGVVVPAVSGPGQLVVNGMSASARSGRWSNSGMVVEIRPDDFPEYAHHGVFRLMALQEELEEKFFKASPGKLVAPAQRMVDFTKGVLSKSLPKSSYVPGLKSDRLDLLLPPFIAERLKKGFLDFGRKSRGFLTNEAVMIGLESRTSSPVRLPRDKETLTHIGIKDLYPAGEGAGYAGGIVSAAIDGMRCADSCIKSSVVSRQKLLISLVNPR